MRSERLSRRACMSGTIGTRRVVVKRRAYRSPRLSPVRMSLPLLNQGWNLRGLLFDQEREASVFLAWRAGNRPLVAGFG